MDIVLRPHWSYAMVYIHDVVIHLTTWADHLHHLREVLSSFHQAELTANPKKCHLGLKEL